MSTSVRKPASVPQETCRRESEKLPWGYLGVTLGGACLLSALLNPWAPFLLLFSSLCAWGLLLVGRWPQWEILLIILGAQWIPFSFGTNTQTQIHLLLVLVPVLVVGYLLKGRLFERGWDGATFALLLFLLFGSLSFLLGLRPWHPIAETAPLRAQLGGLGSLFISGGVFLLAARLGSERQIRFVTWGVLAAGSIFLVAYFLPLREWGFERLFPERMSGSLFWTWFVALSFSQSLVNKDLNWLFRVFLIAATGVVFYITFFHMRHWASGWLPAGVAVAAIVLLYRPLFGLLGALGGALILLWNFEMVAGKLLIGDQSYSLMTRLEAIQALWDPFWLSPWLGLGPANYYFYTPTWPILGWYVHFSSHNQYVDLLMQFGLLGLTCFAVFLLLVGWYALQLLQADLEGFPTALAYGGLGGIAGMLAAGFLGDWILPFVYNITLEGMRASFLGWLFLGCIAALTKIHLKNGGRG